MAGSDIAARINGVVALGDGLEAKLNTATLDLTLKLNAGLSAGDRILAINLKGVWLCMKYEIAHMLKQGGGAIVNTASGAGLIGVRRGGAYVASKHGVVGLTKTAALEYAKAGIRVNCVCPGPIDTPMLLGIGGSNQVVIERMVAAQPGGRLGKPAEIAEAAVWLCSDAASFITGLPMPVDGGYTAQ